MNFKIGEVATIQNAEFHPERNGTECCIVEAGHFGLSRSGEVVPAYLVRLPAGGEVLAAHYQLRKRRPPSTEKSELRQAMLDCIERARRGQEVSA